MANPSYFAGSHSFVIEGGGNFATVQGNQILNYFNREPERKAALTLYDQVMLGDIYRTKDFGVYRNSSGWDYGKPKADRTICAAQVTGVEGRAFTMISYTGPEAQEAFEKDFQMYATTLTTNPFQVYGINTNVPTVLFYDERQPLAKFLDGLGLFGKFYVQSLKKQLNCHKNEIWLDPKKGELCQGPAGPQCYTISLRYMPWGNLSCSAKLLQDSNCLPFLASHKAKSVNREVVGVIALEWSRGDSKVEVHQPTICSASTNATVAVSGGLWKSYSSCLGEREVVENGATRLMLKDEGKQLLVQIDWLEEWIVWMSQALSIFHVHGISLDDNLSEFELLIPGWWLEGHLSDSETKCQQRCEKHIYLFVHPLSPSAPTEDCKTSSLHYWSFDLTGQHPLPAEMCEDLGLPIELSFKVYSTNQYCWENEAYKWMHQYQVARGFDPKTTDFAQHLGYHIYQIHYDSDQFEDVDVTTASSVQSSLSEPIDCLSTTQPLAISKKANGTSMKKEPTSLLGNQRSISRKAAKDEDGISGKRVPPRMTQGGPVKGRETALQETASRRNILSRPPPKAASTSSNLRASSRTPGNPASWLPTKSTPSVSTFLLKRPQIPPRESTHVHRTVTRDAAKPEMTSGKATPGSSQTRKPLPSMPTQIVSPPPKLRMPRSAVITPALTHSANPSSFVTRISGARPTPNAGTCSGIGGNATSPGMHDTTKTPSKEVKQCRDCRERPRLVEAAESDSTSDLLWPAQEAERDGSLERLESDGDGDAVRGKQPHILNGMAEPGVQTDELKDENRRLKEEIERLKEVEENRRLKAELERLKETLGAGASSPGLTRAI